MPGQLVLDLGCGVGDVAELLVERGAQVVGLDLNEESLAAARSRGLARAEFRAKDLRALPAPEQLVGAVDGLWSGFSLAYFTDPEPVVRGWLRHLRPGGWITLVEIDDLFAHEPLDARARELLEGYVEQGLTQSRYDFRMGRRLTDVLSACGCSLLAAGALRDLEFARNGALDAEVLAGWSERFDYMTLLRQHCAAEFDNVRAQFLDALRSPAHRSRSSVRFAVAVK